MESGQCGKGDAKPNLTAHAHRRKEIESERCTVTGPRMKQMVQGSRTEAELREAGVMRTLYFLFKSADLKPLQKAEHGRREGRKEGEMDGRMVGSR